MRMQAVAPRQTAPHLRGKMTLEPSTAVADTLPLGVVVPALTHMGNEAASAGGRINWISEANDCGLYVVGFRVV